MQTDVGTVGRPREYVWLLFVFPRRPSFCVGGGGVVCARWCPALPRPGGRSTIGAGGLSFRVRDGSGRCLPAMTTETCGGVCGARAALFVGCCSVVLWVVVVLPAPRRRLFRGWGWVGGGLHSGRGVVLGAGSPPLWCVGGCGVPLLSGPLFLGVWGGVGVCVCVGLLVPVGFGRCRSSTSGLSTQWSAGGLPAARGAAAETWS